MIAAKPLFCALLVSVLLTPPHGAWSRALFKHAAPPRRTSDACDPDGRAAGASTAGDDATFITTEPEEAAASLDVAPWCPVAAPLETDADLGTPAGDSLEVVSGSVFPLQVADPFDDEDLKLKKGRRRCHAERTATPPRQSPVIATLPGPLPPAGIALPMRAPRFHDEVAPLPHFGSGPCHSIPRPREGTIWDSPPNDSLMV